MSEETIFSGESWSQLVGFLEKLPRPVKIVIWAAEDGGRFEREAVNLGQGLARRFDVIRFERRDRVPDHYHYPVIGLFGLEQQEEVDYGLRLIGLPAGYQINSLVGAVQAVAFRASNLEGRTRIQLSRLPAGAGIDLEVFTSAENEAGTLVATLAAGLAVASNQVRTFIIMADVFPDVAMRYSVRNLPHTVINGRIHIEGLVDEAGMLKQVARAVPK